MLIFIFFKIVDVMNIKLILIIYLRGLFCLLFEVMLRLLE